MSVLINIFPKLASVYQNSSFSEQNSEILKYYLFSIKKIFFFILEKDLGEQSSYLTELSMD